MSIGPQEEPPPLLVELEVEAPTLARFDAGAQALGSTGEALRAGGVAPAPVRGQEEAVLRALCTPEERRGVPEEARLETATVAAEAFFASALADSAAAMQKARAQAEAAGVWQLLLAEQRKRRAPPLARALTHLEPASYSALYREWPIGEATEYLLLGMVDHISKNFDDYC